MAEKAALLIFWTFMLLCASSALALLWAGQGMPAKVVPTFFIIGFAGFLVWAPLVTYKFLSKLG